MGNLPIINDKWVHQLNTLPETAFPTSIYVDLLHFISCEKPCVRIYLQNITNHKVITNWCKRHNFAFYIDQYGYICIAHSINTAKEVLRIDKSTIPHTFQLGQMLGYPHCCCDFVAKIGEANIDVLEKEIISAWEFSGLYKLINPIDYKSGKALICHLQCSTTCTKSLQLAQKALDFIKTYYD